MAKRRKVNLPLIEVIAVSLIVHIAAILVLGGITIYTALQPDEPEMEAPPPPEKIETQKLQHQVKLQEQQKKSSRPRQKISVTNVSQLNTPSLDLNLPNIDTRVAIGTGYGAGGMGRSFGSGGIDFSKSAVDFFGIKSSGERIFFIVDASKYMLEDQKGGIPAYDIIKDEISQMVGRLAAGTLFNVAFYNGATIQSFSSNLIPATQQNKERFRQWVQPINKDFNSIGKLQNNLSVQRKDIKPMLDKPHQWVKALQAAMEQGSDSINLIVSDWQWHGLGLQGEELEEWYLDRDWGPEQELNWNSKVQEAQEWLRNENAERRKAGKPERIVHWIGIVVRELHPKERLKPSPAFTPEEVTKHISNASRQIYRDLDKRPAPVNVVLFLGSDEEKNDNVDVDRFKGVAGKNRGKFRVLEGMSALKNVTGRNSG